MIQSLNQLINPSESDLKYLKSVENWFASQQSNIELEQLGIRHSEERISLLQKSIEISRTQIALYEEQSEQHANDVNAWINAENNKRADLNTQSNG